MIVSYLTIIINHPITSPLMSPLLDIVPFLGPASSTHQMFLPLGQVLHLLLTVWAFLPLWFFLSCWCRFVLFLFLFSTNSNSIGLVDRVYFLLDLIDSLDKGVAFELQIFGPDERVELYHFFLVIL